MQLARCAFVDHEPTERLGSGSFDDAPVVEGGRMIATVCSLARIVGGDR